MKAAFTTFFRNTIARAAAALAVFVVFAGLVVIVLDTIENGPAVVWAIGSILTMCVPLLFLAVVIEYLSRIADALEKPGGLGFEDEAGE